MPFDLAADVKDRKRKGADRLRSFFRYPRGRTPVDRPAIDGKDDTRMHCRQSIIDP